MISCGAKIASAIRSGGEVIVASLFTEAGPNSSAAQKALYVRRREDDREAACLLGAEAVHLGFTDCPFRSSCYKNFNTILFHHSLPEAELKLLQDVRGSIQELIIALQPHELFFPLGVGGHIDHHIAFESSLPFLDGTIPCTFYEDLPYAEIPGWTAARLLKLKALPVDDATTSKITFQTSLTDLPFPFIHSYIASQEDSKLSSIKFEGELAQLPSHNIFSAEWRWGDRCFHRSSFELEPPCLLKKCASIGCYSTEWPILFGSHLGSIKEMLKTTETYWMLK